MSRLVATVLSVCAIAAVSACGGGETNADGQSAGDGNPAGVVISDVHQNTTFEGTEPAKPYAMPDITLTDTDGQAFNLRTDTKRPVTLVFFGYTHCPDECPLVMSDTTAALNKLPHDVRQQVQMIFITTDPPRDTPKVLRTYLDRYDSHYVGLTGDLSTIMKAAKKVGVAISGKEKLPSGGYDVGHSAQVIGFKGNHAPVFWPVNTPVSDMVADIEKLSGR